MVRQAFKNVQLTSNMVFCVSETGAQFNMGSFFVLMNFRFRTAVFIPQLNIGGGGALGRPEYKTVRLSELQLEDW